MREHRSVASGAAPEVKAGIPVAALGLKLPLETLPPGAYRLELRATDRRAFLGLERGLEN